MAKTTWQGQKEAIDAEVRAKRAEVEREFEERVAPAKAVRQGEDDRAIAIHEAAFAAYTEATKEARADRDAALRALTDDRNARVKALPR